MRFKGKPLNRWPGKRGPVSASLTYLEVHAAFEWGVDLDRWFRLPSSVRAMMIAYVQTRDRLVELVTDDASRRSGITGVSTLHFA